MPICTNTLPLSLYVHIPWCVQKCPYCDFNSHKAPAMLPEERYVAALLQELEEQRDRLAGRSLVSVFFGGGTPSLFSGKSIETILQAISQSFALTANTEITLEANPGTIDQVRFKEFKQAGINRLSLGIQSFQDDKLQVLGRIHHAEQAKQAIRMAQALGYTNFNLDLMYGLPKQTLEDALYDLKTALSFNPTHVSWYQLTIEPQTLFYHQPPVLPQEDNIWEMQLAGFSLLKTHQYHHYEVSAFAQPGKACVHNRNYWEFGDYLGIGAGAHSKITLATGEVVRFSQVKHPKDYLDPDKRKIKNDKPVTEAELIFEFMLNALRLTDGVPLDLFAARTGLNLCTIEKTMKEAKNRGLLRKDARRLCPSALGKRFLNDLISLFLPAS